MLHGRTIVARVYGADNGMAGPTMSAGLTMNFATAATCGTASAFTFRASFVYIQTEDFLPLLTLFKLDSTAKHSKQGKSLTPSSFTGLRAAIRRHLTSVSVSKAILYHSKR